MDTDNGFLTGSATMPSFLRFTITPFRGTLGGLSRTTTANAYVFDSCTPVCLVPPVTLRTALTLLPAAGHARTCRCALSKIRLPIQSHRSGSARGRGYGASHPMGHPRHTMIPSARYRRRQRSATRTARTRDLMCRIFARTSTVEMWLPYSDFLSINFEWIWLYSRAVSQYLGEGCTPYQYSSDLCAIQHPNVEHKTRK